MSKNYKQDAEERSVFLTPVEAQGEKDQKGERDGTSPLREARLIDIERIEADPDQPRKRFDKKRLQSLAESMKEVGIIDPATVRYDKAKKVFILISGERRYRAAKMAGLKKIRCIIIEVDEKKTPAIQLVANLQRVNITPLEESAGIKSLIEKCGYSQAAAAKILDKSESYISQILGLERLSREAKEFLQTSEVPKEIQIQASREKDAQKQLEIVKKASEEGKTVRQIRADEKAGVVDDAEKPFDKSSAEARFRKWSWKSQDGRFVTTLKFSNEQSESEKTETVRAALEETLKHLKVASDKKDDPDGVQA